MKKHIIAILAIAIAMAGLIDARGGHGGGHGGSRGGHGGWRGGHGGYRGYGHRGYYRRGGYWGPGWGAGLATAAVIGAAAASDRPTYIQPVVAPAGTNLYAYYMNTYGDPRLNPEAYRNWLYSNYPADVATTWWNSFQAMR